MMYSEFYERTNTEVSAEEYRYIEDSYYDYPGNKDEFCKDWLKDYKAGRWSKEFSLRKALDDQKAAYEKKIAEMEDNLNFYRKAYDSFDHLYKVMKKESVEIEKIQNDLEYTVKHAFDFC